MNSLTENGKLHMRHRALVLAGRCPHRDAKHYHCGMHTCLDCGKDVLVTCGGSECVECSTAPNTKLKMPSFKVTKKEAALIKQIAKRAMAIIKKNKLRIHCDQMDLEMDVTATHANGCALDLEKLLNADDSTFGHDVFGISRYLNRSTGKLGDHFWPHCAKPAAQQVAAQAAPKKLISTIEWKDVTKELPDDGEMVLVTWPDGEIGLAYHDSALWLCACNDRQMPPGIILWARFPDASVGDLNDAA